MKKTTTFLISIILISIGALSNHYGAAIEKECGCMVWYAEILFIGGAFLIAIGGLFFYIFYESLFSNEINELSDIIDMEI